MFDAEDTDVIVVTTATCMKNFLRYPFCLDFIIEDENSQATDPWAVAPIATYWEPKSVLLIGDPKHLEPFTAARESEFYKNAELGFIERLMNTGIRPIVLTLQYRMDPGISAFPNRTFYDGILVNDPSTVDRPMSRMFKTTMSSFLRLTVKETSIFVSVETGRLIATADAFSKANFWTLSTGADLVIHLLSSGFTARNIGIITFYSTQADCHRKFLPTAVAILNWETDSGLEVVTMDGSQGKEWAIPIIGVVTPGSKGNPLGFIAHPKRRVIALTRCKDGLVILNSKNIGQKSASLLPEVVEGNGTENWFNLANAHHAKSSLHYRTVVASKITMVAQKCNYSMSKMKTAEIE